MPLTIWSLKGEKDLQGKYFIALKNVLDLYRKISTDLQHKVNLVRFQVQTAQFGFGANVKQSGTSFGKEAAQKLDCIKNNPFVVIVNLLTIYPEVFPSMINVKPITL